MELAKLIIGIINLVVVVAFTIKKHKTNDELGIMLINCLAAILLFS